MKVFLTGSDGQLGSEILKLLKVANTDVYEATHESCDITSPKIIDLIKCFEPDTVIHTAALTDVDRCEREMRAAYTVNSIGTRNIAVGAAKVEAKLVYVSTDYVFDGKSRQPYHEFSDTNPINIYGRSKLFGEDFTKHFSSRFFIVRTSGLYGSRGRNFVKTILKFAENREELKVVNDQYVTPTYACDLAALILGLVKTDLYGIYHAVNSGSCSWFDFASEILSIAGINCSIKSISSIDLDRTALRPCLSSLDSISLEIAGLKMRRRKEAISEFILNGDY